MKIIIRPLKRDEATLWISLGVPEAEKPTRLQKLTNYLASNPDLPPENYLIAEREGKLIGKLYGVRESTGYMVMGASVLESEPASEIASKLFAYVRRFGTTEALSWQKPEDAPWRDLLEQCGFSIIQDKAYFRKKVENYKTPHHDSLSYKSMHELGTEAFLAILKRMYVGNLNRNFNEAAPESDYQSHVESAGVLFSPEQWFVAYSQGEAAGILLPQRFPDVPHEGTLLTFGLLPQFRSRGLGKVLHARGLEFLSRQGATDYIGSTDIRNRPMLKVFETNDCRSLGIRTTHRL